MLLIWGSASSPRIILLIFFTTPMLFGCGMGEEECRQKNRKLTLAQKIHLEVTDPVQYLTYQFIHYRLDDYIYLGHTHRDRFYLDV